MLTHLTIDKVKALLQLSAQHDLEKPSETVVELKLLKHSPEYHQLRKALLDCSMAQQKEMYGLYMAGRNDLPIHSFAGMMERESHPTTHLMTIPNKTVFIRKALVSMGYEVTTAAAE